jgi:TonB family protein
METLAKAILLVNHHETSFFDFNFVLCGLMTFAQDDTSSYGELILNDGCIDISPHYAGGNARLKKLMTDSMNYPIEAEKQGIGGTVKVVFAVDTFGNIMSAKIQKGIRDDIDKEALRLVGLLKEWTPGTINGKKSVHYLVLPITFNMEKRSNPKHNARSKGRTSL